MPSDSSERRATKANQVGAAPLEPEQLQCPRCDSTNTKFCYYNNYNFSQPRHFCKACRRYWTRGGTLRDIPIGGGSRKNAKRSRIVVSGTTSSSLSFPSTTSTHDYPVMPTTTSPLLAPLSADHGGLGGPVPFLGDTKPGMNVCGSFTSLLSTQGRGLFALGGIGLGIEDTGFGLGRTVWPFPGVGIAHGGAAGAGTTNMLGNTWQLQSGEGGITGGDCFPLSDVAISTLGIGNGMK